MTSPHTPSKPLSSASRTAARARMRARAAANVASQSPQNDNEPARTEAVPKVEDTHFSLSSLPPALVGASSSKNHDIYPQPESHFGHSNTDAIEPQNSPSVFVPASDGYLHTGFTSDASKAERNPPEPDAPLFFRRRPISENTQTAQSAGHTRQGADSAMLGVRPRVKLYHELEDGDEGDIETRPSNSESDSPYIPGPDAENNLRCLKWLMNVEKSGGHKRS